LTALINDGCVSACLMYFGGFVLPYVVRDVRLDGVSYLIIGSVERPSGSGWGDALPLLYYRELLHYKFDPLEAAAFEDEYWRKHRVDVVLVQGVEVVRLQAIHMPTLKHTDYQDPVKKLEGCFQAVHMFRIFGISDT